MAIPFRKVKTKYDFADVMPFGEHQGKTISWIIEFDPEYLQWCSKKQNLIYLSSKCIDVLEDRVGIAKFNKVFQAAKRQSEYLHKTTVNDWDWEEDIPF